MIEPFHAGQVKDGNISYGLSSYGYDIRVAPEFKVFTNVHNVVVDPKNFDARSFVDVHAKECIIPPNSFALARTEEYFRIPRDVLVVCVGKSTYARCGIIVNVTPLEPTWCGLPHPGDLQHHSPAGQDLRRRGHRPASLLPGRRRAGGGLRRPEGEVHEPAGGDAAEVVGGREGLPSPAEAQTGEGFTLYTRPPPRTLHPKGGSFPDASPHSRRDDDHLQ